ncbi:chemotaxis protein CheA [Halocynthiibacter sp. SDUM655004]|uniref:Chemotaxis protein CheA n=2 Tax=Paracoccaceae TaxID=31989 RepID=A0AAE3J0Z2_9RHOB|nr:MULTISPECIES: chemotaxis protein CheA [Halocynthiibacter]MCV6824481.1 chemotaxis protein CheA [Halocynthiibacter halioticoli]MCW4057482.1 chemotaxis protein CheA [Halocynthiibacter sp. SDUM655004]
MSDPNDPMAEIRVAFFQECEELLEALQDGLTSMEDGSGDSETINVVFRAVHSIKGGAGAFGLDELVQFAHRFETTMDAVRAGELTVDTEALKLFFRAADVLSDIVRASRDALETDQSAILAVCEELIALTGADAEEDEIDPAEFQATGLTLDLDLPDLDALDDIAVDLPPLTSADSLFGEDTIAREPSKYTIRFKPTSELYATGNEPLYLFRTLREIGVVKIDINTQCLPELSKLEPENSYLEWQLKIETEENENQIREVFDFVSDICDLEIKSNGMDAEVSCLPDILPNEAATDQVVSSSEVSNAIATPAQTENLAPSADQTVENASDNAAEIPLEVSPKPAQTPPATKPRATVRVDLERVDRLVNLVGELVINQAMLSQSVAQIGLPSNTPVFTGLDELQQLTRDIQDSVMMIRAQPVKSLFQRMARIVREASADVGKTVRLKTDGDATEVDKTVIERLADPLTHMIRNAVDHGLEDSKTRLANGKPETGEITLSARHRSGRVLIEISDDGAGIDRKKVLKKAQEKELVTKDGQLTDSEIDNLLFLPGFSTADKISNLSGRGVGMDVVRSSIQALGGRVSINSTPGKGTTFSISLPLTLAVLDGMVTQVAGQTLVVPLNTIEETLTIGKSDLNTLGPQTSVLKVRNGFVPLLDLGTELGYRKPKPDYVDSIVLLIAHEDGSRAALVVDEINDQRQVVIKGLQESYGRVPGIAAATILGDGQIALILDPVDIVAGASGRTKLSTETALAG